VSRQIHLKAEVLLTGYRPTGGRYDGILGVCAGIEMLRVLQDEKIESEYPIGVINWTKYANF
jgi:hypothetical protein